MACFHQYFTLTLISMLQFAMAFKTSMKALLLRSLGSPEELLTQSLPTFLLAIGFTLNPVPRLRNRVPTQVPLLLPYLDGFVFFLVDQWISSFLRF